MIIFEREENRSTNTLFFFTRNDVLLVWWWEHCAKYRLVWFSFRRNEWEIDKKNIRCECIVYDWFSHRDFLIRWILRQTVVKVVVVGKEINTVVKFVFYSLFSIDNWIESDHEYYSSESILQVRRRNIRLSLQSVEAHNQRSAFDLYTITDSNSDDMKITKIPKVKRVPRNALTKSRIVPTRRNTHPKVVETKAFEQGISQTSTPEVSEEFSFSFCVAFFTQDIFADARIFLPWEYRS